MSDCSFCDIVRGDLPASVISQDETSMALLDLFPVHRGHALVIPRTHYRDLASCPPDLAAHLFQVSRVVAAGIVKVTGAEGFNVWTANGRSAGQQVMHFHLHVLPRWSRDRFGLRFPKDYPQEAGREELDRLAREIKEAL